MRICSKIEAAYIAGVFDGEGCVLLSRRNAQVRVTVVQKRPELLYWLQETLGIGTVRQTHTQEKNSSTCWRFGIYGIQDVEDFFHLISPYLIVKASEVLQVLPMLSMNRKERLAYREEHPLVRV